MRAANGRLESACVPRTGERGHVGRCSRHLADGSYSSVSNWIAIPFSMLSGNMPDRAGNGARAPRRCACSPETRELTLGALNCESDDGGASAQFHRPND